jgi:hypothetical protein
MIRKNECKNFVPHREHTTTTERHKYFEMRQQSIDVFHNSRILPDEERETYFKCFISFLQLFFAASFTRH